MESPKVALGDVTIAYEILGQGPRVVVTPGGRFGMNTAGVRELAEALARRNLSVLLWDRPNCGASSVCFTGESESVMWADALAGLQREVGFYPAVLAGGSAGSRVSLLTARRHPDVAAGLYLWWISGGTFGLMNLGLRYIGETLLAAQRAGMHAVAELPSWSASYAEVPDNRDRILNEDRADFLSKMHAWIDHYIPDADSPVPGMGAEDYGHIDVPVTILRSGTSDLHHPPATAEWTHELIAHSRLCNPPWPDDQWHRCHNTALGGGSPFEPWPMLAPEIADFVYEQIEVSPL